MSNILIQSISMVLFLGFVSEAQGYAFFKMDPKGGTGMCLPDPNQDSGAILSENGVKVDGATTAEKDALAKAIYAINNIGDGRFKFHKNAKYRFLNSAGASNYDGNFINIRGAGQNSVAFSGSHCHGSTCHATGRNNVAHLVHELGHYVGNQSAGRGSVYAAYEQAMRGRICGVSGYAFNRVRDNHEEFAEVFAAYVTNPEGLRQQSNCGPAVEFFRTYFGESKAPQTCEERLASIEGGSYGGGNRMIASAGGGGSSGGGSGGSILSALAGAAGAFMKGAGGGADQGYGATPQVYIPGQDRKIGTGGAVQ